MAKHFHASVCREMQGTVSSCACPLVALLNLHVCCNLLMSQCVCGLGCGRVLAHWLFLFFSFFLRDQDLIICNKALEKKDCFI